METVEMRRMCHWFPGACYSNVILLPPWLARIKGFPFQNAKGKGFSRIPHELNCMYLWQSHFMSDKVETFKVRAWQLSEFNYGGQDSVLLPTPSKVIVAKAHDGRKVTPGRVEVVRHAGTTYNAEKEKLPRVDYYAPWDAFQFTKGIEERKKGFITERIPAYHSALSGLVVLDYENATKMEDEGMKNYVFDLVLRLEKLNSEIDDMISLQNELTQEMNINDPEGRVLSNYRAMKEKIQGAIKRSDQ